MDASKLKVGGIWTLTGITSALFLMSALPKFMMPGWVGRFAAWGYPEWFLYVIATLEALGAVGLLIPRFASYAAAGLVVIMIGAIYTHLTHDEGILWNLGYIASLLTIAHFRWPQRIRPQAPEAA